MIKFWNPRVVSRFSCPSPIVSIFATLICLSASRASKIHGLALFAMSSRCRLHACLSALPVSRLPSTTRRAYSVVLSSIGNHFRDGRNFRYLFTSGTASFVGTISFSLSVTASPSLEEHCRIFPAALSDTLT